MQKTYSKNCKNRISSLLFLLASFTFVFSLFFSMNLQINAVDVPLDTKSNNLDFLILAPLILFSLVALLLYKKYQNFFIKTFIIIFAVLGSLHSLLFIYYKMSGFTNGWISIDNNTNFTGIYFFAFYTFLYNGFLCDWWDKQIDSLKKYILLCLIEVPNVIAWWILGFSAPMNYVKNINDPGHFWMTLFFALTVVIALTGIRLSKISDNEKVNH